MRKSIKKNKKALLMAAVLSALEVGSVVGNVGLPMANVAEAADNHPDIFVGRHQAGNGDRVGVPVYLRWNMSANRYGIYIDGHGFQNTDLYETIKANPIDKENIVKQTFEDKSTDIALAVANAINAGQITASSVTSDTINQVVNSTALQNKLNQKANTSDVTAAENRAKSDATNKANVAESNAKAYTDAIAAVKANTSLNNITDAGKNVIRDLAKEAMKNTGVKTDGPTVIIEKTTEIKGGLDVDGPIHGKGDMEVDGKTTLHGDTIIEGDTIIKGKTINQGEVVNETTVTNKGNVINEADVTTKGTTTHEGKTINKGEVVNETTVTNKGDVINEANVTTKGTTTHEGEVINKSLVTNESDVHTKGNEIIDGNATIHGNTTIDGTTTLKGDTVIGDSAEDKVIVNGTAEFKENAPFDKDVTVKGSQTIEQNLRVKGDSVTEGNSTVEGGATVKGNTTLGDDKNADVLEVNAKANIHGDTTIGDSSDDKFTVNATSEFKADATFDQNVLVKGDQTVEGNSYTKGNAEVDKDLAVHGSEVIDGDSVVHGDSTVDGKFHAKSDAEFDQNVTIHGSETVDGDSHIKGNIEVDKDITVHGAMVVDGGMKVSDDFGTKGNMTVDKTLTVGGDAHISGDTILDGKFFAKGAAEFGDSVDIAKNLTVGGNAHVNGDSVVDGDSYARSYNIGNEKYIDSNGINANNHKIRNVADGEIGLNSLDAVNGRQLWHTRERLQHNINQVGAGAAAMASLHPLDYEHDDKLSVSAAMGNYKDKTAMAVGAFYRPNIKSMINLSGTLGYGDNMFGIGVTTKMGKVTEADTMTDEQLRDKVSEIHDENKELREENGKLKAEIAKSNERDTAQENQIAALTAKNHDLEKGLSNMTVAYNQLMSKVDIMAAELASLKADSQK